MSISLPEAHKRFREYFPGLSFNDFMEPTLTVVFRAPKLDPFKFDDWLHEIHGDYEGEGLCMSEVLEQKHGQSAARFIESLL
jgi:hypothetical protein